MKKNIYLILAILGFILPTYFVLKESIDTGNIMLYADPKATLDGMLATRISTIFSIDLLFAVLVFFIWSYYEHQQKKIKGTYISWGISMLFGLASGFPLFLYLREVNIENNTENEK